MLSLLKNKIVLFFLFNAGVILPLHSQLWQNVGNGVSNDIRDLFPDPSTNNLYMSGSFRYADTIECRGMVYWNGNNYGKFNPVNSNYCWSGDGCGPTVSIVKYNNRFFAAGIFIFNTKFSYLLEYINNQWTPCCAPNKNDGAVYSLKNVNGKLFALGSFDSLCNKKIKRIAVWENNAWNEFVPSSTGLFGAYGNEAISCAEYYKGEYYFAGNTGGNSGFNEIVRWNGSQWQQLQNGLVGDPWVTSLKVYKGLLYVGGNFYKSAGNVSSFLAAWDGEKWIEPFPGVQFLDEVRDMEVINDKLYLTSTYIIPADNDSLSYQLARYDGCNFGAFGIKLKYPKYSGVPLTIAGMHNRIYVAHPPDTLDNKPTTNFIYFNENVPDFRTINMSECPVTPEVLDFDIYPNPVSSMLTITGNFSNAKVTLTNMLGQIIFEWNGAINDKLNIPIQSLSEAVYYISVSENGEYIGKKKIIKMEGD